jgi:hypothetical protein
MGWSAIRVSSSPAAFVAGLFELWLGSPWPYDRISGAVDGLEARSGVRRPRARSDTTASSAAIPNAFPAAAGRGLSAVARSLRRQRSVSCAQEASIATAEWEEPHAPARESEAEKAMLDRGPHAVRDEDLDLDFDLG